MLATQATCVEFAGIHRPRVFDCRQWPTIYVMGRFVLSSMLLVWALFASNECAAQVEQDSNRQPSSAVLPGGEEPGDDIQFQPAFGIETPAAPAINLLEESALASWSGSSGEPWLPRYSEWIAELPLNRPWQVTADPHRQLAAGDAKQPMAWSLEILGADFKLIPLARKHPRGLVLGTRYFELQVQVKELKQNRPAVLPGNSLDVIAAPRLPGTIGTTGTPGQDVDFGFERRY